MDWSVISEDNNKNNNNRHFRCPLTNITKVFAATSMSIHICQLNENVSSICPKHASITAVSNQRAQLVKDMNLSQQKEDVLIHVAEKHLLIQRMRCRMSVSYIYDEFVDVNNCVIENCNLCDNWCLREGCDLEDCFLASTCSHTLATWSVCHRSSS